MSHRLLTAVIITCSMIAVITMLVETPYEFVMLPISILYIVGILSIIGNGKRTVERHDMAPFDKYAVYKVLSAKCNKNTKVNFIDREQIHGTED